MNKNYYPLPPGIYDPHTSLADHIYMMCDPNKEIEGREIANLVVKYFFCYVHTAGYSEMIDEEDIAQMFSNFDTLERGLMQQINGQGRSIDAFLYCGYQLKMLGDIGATVAIFSDIVHRKIENVYGGRDYRGLDLGTGSGILLLAQFIQAFRNRFIPHPDRNIGIEINSEVVNYSREIADKLGFGSIITGDTASAQVYTQIGQEGLHFVSSENIPRYGQTFADSPQTREPFFESWVQVANITAIQDTQFFPQQIEIGGKILDRGRQIVDLSNQDHLVKMILLYQALQGGKKDASGLLHPLGVEILGRMTALNEVGKVYEGIGISFPPIMNETRW